jgi:hypothetical protein
MKKIFVTIILYIFIFNNILASIVPNRKAIIIGIQNYRNYGSLRGSHGDVDSMVALLKMSRFEDDHIWIIKDDSNNPMITASDLYSHIMSFSRTIQSGDEVIFFFSGHGVGDRSGNNYLLGYDGNMDAPERFSINVNEIKTMLKENIPSEIILIIDACRDYVVKEGKGAGKTQTAYLNTGKGVRIQDMTKLKYEYKTLKPGERVSTVIKTIYASSEGQKSYERRDRNNGIFTYYLTYLVHSPDSVMNVDMSKDGTISIEDLVVFADNRIREFVRNNNLPKMNPVYQTEGGILYPPFKMFRYSIASPKVMDYKTISEKMDIPDIPDISQPTKIKKPFYKKWWFWGLVGVGGYALSTSGSSNGNEETEPTGTIGVEW